MKKWQALSKEIPEYNFDLSRITRLIQMSSEQVKNLNVSELHPMELWVLAEWQIFALKKSNPKFIIAQTVELVKIEEKNQKIRAIFPLCRIPNEENLMQEQENYFFKNIEEMTQQRLEVFENLIEPPDFNQKNTTQKTSTTFKEIEEDLYASFKFPQTNDASTKDSNSIEESHNIPVDKNLEKFEIINHDDLFSPEIEEKMLKNKYNFDLSRITRLIQMSSEQVKNLNVSELHPIELLAFADWQIQSKDLKWTKVLSQTKLLSFQQVTSPRNFIQQENYFFENIERMTQQRLEIFKNWIELPCFNQIKMISQNDLFSPKIEEKMLENKITNFWEYKQFLTEQLELATTSQIKENINFYEKRIRESEWNEKTPLPEGLLDVFKNLTFWNNDGKISSIEKDFFNQLIEKIPTFLQFVDKLKRTPLHLAIKSNYLDMVKLLLEKGASLKAKNNFGQNALICATENDHTNITQILIANGADVNAKTRRGDQDAPLHYAVRANNFDMIKLLLENNADINIKNNEKETPLHKAINYRNLPMIKYLVETGKADIDFLNEYGKTVLFLAVYKNEMDIVKYLVEKGANLSINDTFGNTVLHVAVEWQNLDIIRYLVEKGADIHSVNKNQQNLLHIAVSYKPSLKIIEFLCNNHVALNVKDKWGYTPLQTETPYEIQEFFRKHLKSLDKKGKPTMDWKKSALKNSSTKKCNLM